MCGIAGFLNRDTARADRELLEGMLETIIHRGPDDWGTYLKADLGIGMRRLSIIDLPAGHQPISNENNTVHIVFNGEIYNYLELKQQLRAKGHVFKTESDTETIIHLYEDYGEECVRRLNGMFAFAIWDENKKILFCARDHVGIKPFYYYVSDKKFAFASELKALLVDGHIEREMDLTGLFQFLSFEFIPCPKTLLKSVHKLPPGHSLTVSHQGMEVKKYWHLEKTVSGNYTEGEALEKLEELLKDAVKLQVRSDVPFGAFLSGGIDSSTIASLMTDLLGGGVKTFSIGFENSSYNELDYATLVSEKNQTDHTEKILDPSSVELIEKLVTHMDDPVSDFSIFPTYIVSCLAREKVKVVLSGDGGDELFGGYDTYVAQKMYKYYSCIPGSVRHNIISPLCHLLPPTSKKKGIVNKIKRYVQGAELPPHLEHFRWMIFWSEDEYAKILTKETYEQVDLADSFSFIPDYLDAMGNGGLNRSMFLDVKSYLTDNILVKVDRMSMAASLETRVPFLDYRIVEFAFSIPDSYKIKGTTTKYILKKMAEKYLPPEIIHRPKQGFSIPMKNWLKGPLKDMMHDLLSTERIKRQDIFNPHYVKKLVDEHVTNTRDHSHKLWELMLIQFWNDNFLKRTGK